MMQKKKGTVTKTEVLAEVRITIQKWILTPFCSYVTFASTVITLGWTGRKQMFRFVQI